MMILAECCYVPTRRGNQLCQSAHERMINRNPTARTNDRRITAEDGSMRYNFRQISRSTYF